MSSSTAARSRIRTLALVMVVASTLSLVQVRSLSTLHREFVDEQFAILTHVEGAALDASRAATAERGYLLAGNSRFVEEVRVEHLPAVRDHLDAAAGVNPDAVGLLTPVNEAFVAWTDSLEEEFDLYTRDPFSAQMMAFINPLAQRLEFEEALAAVTEATTAAVAEADAQSLSVGFGPIKPIDILEGAGQHGAPITLLDHRRTPYEAVPPERGNGLCDELEGLVAFHGARHRVANHRLTGLGVRLKCLLRWRDGPVVRPLEQAPRSRRK